MAFVNQVTVPRITSYRLNLHILLKLRAVADILIVYV